MAGETEKWPVITHHRPLFAALQKQSPRCVREFLGAHPHLCVGVITIKLQSKSAEIALPHGCSAVSLFHVCKTSFLDSTSRELLLNTEYI